MRSAAARPVGSGRRCDSARLKAHGGHHGPNPRFFSDLWACRGHPRMLALLRNWRRPGKKRGGCCYFKPGPASPSFEAPVEAPVSPGRSVAARPARRRTLLVAREIVGHTPLSPAAEAHRSCKRRRPASQLSS